MKRVLDHLTTRRFDVLVIGGGIHGLAIAYDAAQRGLATALIDRGDFGSGSSFNHAKTVHGGLRSLQSGDVVKARLSMRERRAIARMAPHLVEPLGFMMATGGKLMRSAPVLRAGLALDAVVAFDRNRGVPAHLHLPAGRVVGAQAYRTVFGANASGTATGAAHWWDYHMAESDRLTIGFAQAAAGHGAVLANYVEAVEPVRRGPAVAGVRARDAETGSAFDIEAAVVVNAAGAGSRAWSARLGRELTFPLIKATNVVTTRPAGPIAMGAPTAGGRLLLIMPWRGCALVGTSHSETEVGADDTGVSPAELHAFIDEINSAFPALRLTAGDVRLVHRGVVPGQRSRRGELGLMGHHIIHDHAADGVRGAFTVVGVKYTTGRGVAEQVVDRVLAALGKPAVPCRTGHTLLPGAFAHPPAEEAEQAIRGSQGVLGREAATALVRTHGTGWADLTEACRRLPDLAAPVDLVGLVPAAVVARAVRDEMARTLLDVVVRRTNLGSAGHPGSTVIARCAAVMAAECGWDAARVRAEVEAVGRFYAPVVVGG